MAAPAGVDQQFVMLRTAMLEKIFEYIGKKQMPAQWQKRNDYYNMMKEPIVRPLHYAIKTLSAQNQQNQQNPQTARDTESSSAMMTPDVEQFASLLTDVQNNNADELDVTE